MIDYNITRITNNRGDNIIYMDTKALLDYLWKDQLLEALGQTFHRTKFKNWCWKNSLTKKHKRKVKDKFGNLLPNKRNKYSYQGDNPISTCVLRMDDSSFRLQNVINGFFSSNEAYLEEEYVKRIDKRRNGITPGKHYLKTYSDNKPTCHIDTREMKPVMYIPYELTYGDTIKLQNQINAVIKAFKPTKVKETKRFKSSYTTMLGRRCIKKWFNWELVSKEGSYSNKWKYTGNKE